MLQTPPSEQKLPRATATDRAPVRPKPAKTNETRPPAPVGSRPPDVHPCAPRGGAISDRGNDDFGHLLRQLRIDRHQSCADVAESVLISIVFYDAIERGDKHPTLPIFARLQNHFQFDANAVLDQLQVTLYAPAKVKRGPGPAKRRDKAGPYATFGRRLADARRDSQLTQFALARAIRASSSHVIRIERGYTLPSIIRMAQLRRVLRFDANVMLTHLASNPRGSTPTKETNSERPLAVSHEAPP